MAISSSATDRRVEWAFTEEFPTEDQLLKDARAESVRLGAVPVSPATASLLTLLAASTAASNVLEIGTGAGVSTLALLDGMLPSSALTTVDIDRSRVQAAKSLIDQHRDVRKHRVRTITGDVADVLPRLSAGSYDLIFVDAGVEVCEYSAYQALALLKNGGLLILNNALNSGSVAQPAARDEVTVALRRLIHDIAECTSDVHVSLVHAQQGIFLIYKKYQ